MNVKIQYYGMIAECTSCQRESFSLEELVSVKKLDTLLKEKHPKLENVSYKIAVSQNFVSVDTIIEPNQEIALLPPFAGG